MPLDVLLCSDRDLWPGCLSPSGIVIYSLLMKCVWDRFFCLFFGCWCLIFFKNPNSLMNNNQVELLNTGMRYELLCTQLF